MRWTRPPVALPTCAPHLPPSTPLLAPSGNTSLPQARLPPPSAPPISTRPDPLGPAISLPAWPPSLLAQAPALPPSTAPISIQTMSPHTPPSPMNANPAGNVLPDNGTAAPSAQLPTDLQLGRFKDLSDYGTGEGSSQSSSGAGRQDTPSGAQVLASRRHSWGIESTEADERGFPLSPLAVSPASGLHHSTVQQVTPHPTATPPPVTVPPPDPVPAAPPALTPPLASAPVNTERTVYSWPKRAHPEQLSREDSEDRESTGSWGITQDPAPPTKPPLQRRPAVSRSTSESKGWQATEVQPYVAPELVFTPPPAWLVTPIEGSPPRYTMVGSLRHRIAQNNMSQGMIKTNMLHAASLQDRVRYR